MWTHHGVSMIDASVLSQQLTTKRLFSIDNSRPDRRPADPSQHKSLHVTALSGRKSVSCTVFDSIRQARSKRREQFPTSGDAELTLSRSRFRHDRLTWSIFFTPTSPFTSS